MQKVPGLRWREAATCPTQAFARHEQHTRCGRRDCVDLSSVERTVYAQCNTGPALQSAAC